MVASAKGGWKKGIHRARRARPRGQEGVAAAFGRVSGEASWRR